MALLFVTASEGGLNVVFPPFLERNGYTLEQVGGMVSLFAVLSLASRLPTGALYSRERARLLLSIGLVALAGSTAGYALGTWWAWLTLLTSLHGFAFGVVTTALLALCIDLRPPGYSNAAMMSWYTAALSGGYMIGNGSGGWIAHNFGYGAAFLVLGIALTVSLLAVALVPKPSQTVGSTPQPLEKERSVGAGHSMGEIMASPQNKAPALAAYLDVVRAIPAPVIVATFIGFYINVLDDAFNSFFPIYALEQGLNLAVVGFLRSIKSGCATGIRFMAAGIFRFVSFQAINQICLVVWTLVVFLVPNAATGVMLPVFFVLMGLARGLTRVTSATMVAEAKGDRSAGVGLASGIYNLGLDLGSVLGPLLGGVIAAAIGIPGMFRAVPLGLFLMYMGIIWISRLRRDRDK